MTTILPPDQRPNDPPLCEWCKHDPDPRGASACAACRQIAMAQQVNAVEQRDRQIVATQQLGLPCRRAGCKAPPRDDGECSAHPRPLETRARCRAKNGVGPGYCALYWGHEGPHRFEINEQVNHPAHYGGADNPYEAIKVIEAWELGFCLGNAVKYISRAGKKDQTKLVEDLEKAQFYLNREIAKLKKAQGG